jgi:hypothetical protein
MTRFHVSCVGTLLVSAAALAAAPQGQTPLYSQTGRVPSIVDGDGLYSFAHDPVDKRLYAVNERGLYWVDLAEAVPRIKGPMVTKRFTSIELAPESRRLFYTTMDEVGMLRLGTGEPPVRLSGRVWTTGRWAYEPTRRQMYLPTRDSRMLVFDADSGERAGDVEVPGDYPIMVEALPGRVLFSLSNKSGLYAIDAQTKAVTPWKVTGKFVTPAYLDADPSGRFLFATYDRYVVAIDVASATVVGKLITAQGASIAFDPDRGLMIAAQYVTPGHPRIRLVAYRVDASGFTEVGEMKNPADGLMGLESFRGGGFLQSGHRSLLLWATSPVATPATFGLR